MGSDPCRRCGLVSGAFSDSKPEIYKLDDNFNIAYEQKINEKNKILKFIGQTKRENRISSLTVFI